MQGEGCREADNQAGAVRGREESSTGGQLAQAPSLAPSWTCGVVCLLGWCVAGFSEPGIS